ncbi:hypothetical protein K466DRAFT_605883 [Polyporus arcularius HHB13444]|uniref:Uncharacterized protein n=1 Tax=Polyporus arcularius HHB13444 TaxID=1314778 RepID=A0A5C3NRX5_9APHY|nr:hypothetical protein K466DRAFT_605883 [Polyporus arcularius HHB13444]
MTPAHTFHLQPSATSIHHILDMTHTGTHEVENDSIAHRYVEAVIRAIQYRSVHPSPAQQSDMSYDLIFEEAAQEAIGVYLRGIGHPDDEVFHGFRSAAAFQQDQGDPTLRARMFASFVSGSKCGRDLRDIPRSIETAPALSPNHAGSTATVNHAPRAMSRP